ncbi:MAG: phosphotransferase, partial [Bacteroidota bacterium]
MNKEKEWIYGTHKFLPLFKELLIKTPEILIEDYTKESFSFCYQILTKIEGKDLLEVFHTLSPAQLMGIAQEVSDIMDKFKSLPPVKSFGGFTGLNESHEKDLLSILLNKRKDIEERNKVSGIFDEDILDIHLRLLEEYTPYFQQVKPRLYYDDLNSKNVMIHEGRFNGLVDLDFLLKGDYLESIGSIQAVWYGAELCEMYV